MKSLKHKLVGVAYDNGKCCGLYKVINVDEREEAQLVQECREYNTKKYEEEQAFLKRISDLEKLVGLLEHEIKVLKGEEE